MDLDLQLLRKYYEYRFNQNPEFFISEKTAEDIEIDLAFLYLDTAVSKVGKQYFYSKIRSNEGSTDEFAAYKAFFGNHIDKKQSVECELKKLNEKKDYYIIDLLLDDIYPNQKYYNYARISIAITILILIGSMLLPKLLLGLIPVFIGNMVVHYLNKNYVEFYNSVIYRLQAFLSVAHNIGTLEGLGKEYKSINLKALRKKMRSVGFDTALSKNEYLSVLWFFVEVFRIFFVSEIFSFRRKVNALNNSKPELLKTFEFVGKVDTAIGLNTIQQKMKTCEPEFVDSKTISVEALYHPYIENCVANTLTVQDKSVAITGSNMSGKTSFMRTLAVNAVFAQNFGFCFAEKYLAPKMKIMSSISVHDDLSESKSYYLEEVLRIREFLEDSSGFKLILIDEIFKGTNTTERIAISKSVLKSLNSPKTIVVVTTHDLEIARFLENNDYELYYFDEEVGTNQLTFSYKIKPGINKKTNAIKILEMYGYPKSIIVEAKNYLQ